MNPMSRSCLEHSMIEVLSPPNRIDVASGISRTSMIEQTPSKNTPQFSYSSLKPNVRLSTKQQQNSLSKTQSLLELQLQHGEDASTSSSTVGATSTSSCAGEDTATSYTRVLHLPTKPRPRRQRETGQEEYLDNVPVRVRDYHRQTMQGGGQLCVRVASASMDRKGEDRYNVVFLNNDDKTNTKNNHDLQFFCGVYDGHDGPNAANYCATGLLPHILMELSQHVEHKVTSNSARNSEKRLRGLFRRFSKSSNNRSLDSRDEENNDNDSASNTTRRLSALQPHICRAFENAHEWFAASGTPPDLSIPVQQQTVKTPSLENAGKLSTLMRRAFSEENNDNRRIHSTRPGGTTACTLCIFCPTNTDSDLFALVANCGDSRLVSDHGNAHFRTVTKDHRVVEDVEDPEMVRLHAAHARIQNRRIYPGGLAVSRTIGDTSYADACIPTPDCYALHPGPQRIILATDGLWDALQMIVKQQRQQEQAKQSKQPNLRRSSTARRVEAILDQLAGRDSVADPKTAAINLMKHCLREVGCVDDITIVVVDIFRHAIRT